MRDTTVCIQIVTWNSMRFLPDLFTSLMAQTYQDFTVRVIDNGSTDGVERFLREQYPQVGFLRNARNLGLCAAHNQGMTYALDHWPDDGLSDRFLLLASPDVLFEPTFLERLMAVTRSHPEVAAFGGKLMRAFGENMADEVFQQVVRSDRFDSTGLVPRKNRTITHRGAGELDEGQFDEQEKVFGISSDLVLLRASALQDVAFEGEVLDSDFFAYEEGIDLAWRLQHAGWDALYVPGAVAYHYRGMYDPEKSGLIARIRHRAEASVMRTFFSTRNHWLVLWKNMRISDVLLSGVRVMLHELPGFFYVTFVEGMGLRAVRESLALLPRMWRKRRHILSGATRTPGEVRRWFQ